MRGGQKRTVGFTMLEVVVVLGIMSILVSIAAPSMRNLGRRGVVITKGHQLASMISAARLFAIRSGSVMVAGINPTTLKTFRVAQVMDSSSQSDASMSGNNLAFGSSTLVYQDSLKMILEPGDNTTMLVDANNNPGSISDDVLVWLPNGYLRGDNYGSNTANTMDDKFVVTLDDGRGQRVVVVATHMGLVCVNPGGGTSCP